jgi:ATP-dependent RNA helicase RhlE
MTKHNADSPQLFTDLDLLPSILKAVSAEGYEKPTPIQCAAIPIVLKGNDLLGIAQTGTGKTAAFCLPLMQNLIKSQSSLGPKAPRALILVPTRELAIQVHQSLVTYGKGLNLKHAVIFGGVGQGAQVQALAAGVDVLVATPGRLLDLLGQRHLQLSKVEIFVLDEADRMLDMGFINDVRKVVPLLPKKKQNLFFSATMPNEVQSLADTILREPVRVAVTPQATTVEKIDQKVMFVKREHKMDLLLHLLKNNLLYKVLVFVDMKHMANKVSDLLVKNRISAAAIHGNKSQNARQRAIEDFRNDKLRVLVATDIAARGIDIDGITHVVNFDLPHIVESYVHRIGRTARAGSEGHAVSFCTGYEKSYLFAIEKTTRAKIAIDMNHPFHAEEILEAQIMGVGRAKAMAEAERKQRSGGRPAFKKSGPRSGGGGKPSFGKPSHRPKSSGPKNDGAGPKGGSSGRPAFRSKATTLKSR